MRSGRLTAGLALLLSLGLAGGCETKVEQNVLSLTTPSLGYVGKVSVEFDAIEFPEEDFGEHSGYFGVVKVPQDERVSRFNDVFRELSIYPEKLVRDNLKGIFVVDELTYKGSRWGGTRTNDSIYVSSNDSARVLHAEFSSVLYLNNRDKFPFLAWTSANPAGFWYVSSSTSEDISGSGSDYLRNETLLEEGFVSSYAKIGSDIENDFNGICKALVVDTSRLLEIEQKFPRIRQKVDLTLDFLSVVWGEKLTRDYFLDKGCQRN